MRDTTTLDDVRETLEPCPTCGSTTIVDGDCPYCNPPQNDLIRYRCTTMNCGNLAVMDGDVPSDHCVGHRHLAWTPQVARARVVHFG